ncbi:energy-coupling factor transport system ATP-binding protein [Pseudoclavibacter chungangensis]|uniref:ATP-binding cassette domain-containing protein n=1 Tax=Pseudoclavibacter chungangensis TaxID=587635 RepID=UPI0017E90A18|nr:ABC transporter ATP-binding protein [Pseudoclavibacter chungangensis]NYJ68109.1 energy-coupling factor transport system ATP-binding protein [Pseudoclavibacter chungangensis]
MIELDDVTWTYPHADGPSLVGLDLRIAPGECVVLCGASGSGKSTALRLVDGLVPHFHDEGVLTGTVTVEGITTATAELDELGLVTGTVLQHPRRQFFADTVAEEAAFAMENFGFPSATIRERVGSAVTELAANVPVEQSLQHLSGGQQQQVAIAAATLHEPRIVLLDEPSSNLSADAVDRLTANLAALKARGVTIVVAEHRLRYLDGLLDRVAVMRDGRIGREWSAEAFREVSDETLAREGLRGAIRAPRIAPLPASGASVAGGVDASAAAGGALELVDVRCRLGGRTVLDIERLAFPAGEVTAVRGVNGAGKSTLARIVTGLQRATGTIRLDGRTMTPGRLQRRSAIVMQDVQRQLFTDTVDAEIALAASGARTRTGRDDDGHERPDPSAVLDALDLGALAERHPLSLSGGQQQRLVVASVRVSDRRVVVFDEPSSGVDRRHLQSISDQIRRVAEDGAIVVLISHDDDLLSLAADRVLTLERLGGRDGGPGVTAAAVVSGVEPLAGAVLRVGSEGDGVTGTDTGGVPGPEGDAATGTGLGRVRGPEGEGVPRTGTDRESLDDGGGDEIADSDSDGEGEGDGTRVVVPSSVTSTAEAEHATATATNATTAAGTGTREAR